MIQVYERKKETCLIPVPSSEYVLWNEVLSGIKIVSKVAEDGQLEITLNGTAQSNVRSGLTFSLSASEYGTRYYIKTSIESNSSQVCFNSYISIQGQTDGIREYMRDGEKEMSVLLPKNGEFIKLSFDLKEGCTFRNKTFTIGVYYDNGESDDRFTRNGDMTLLPTEANIHVILNSSWEATLEHTIDEEGRWKYIQEEAVVKLPSFYGKDQLWRIKQKEKRDSGISATLEPIFYDARDDCFLVDIRPTNKSGQDALNLMTAPNGKYQGESNITHTATAYYQFKNLLEAINGDDANSFVNRWGGEILFDDYKVIINERVGGDYGVELRYGKNIPQDGLTEEADIRDVVTRIYPKAYNGYTMTNDGYVDSPLINNYPTIKIRTITFSDVKMREDASEDDEENGVILCDTQAELDAALKQRCEEQYEAGLDKPKVTISADMVLLKDTEAYKDYAVLEDVSLGDTIHCKNSHLGIVTDARVIELEWDCIRKKVESVVLGDYQYNYFNNVDSAVNRIDGAIRPDGSLVAEKIAGFINGAMTSLRAQSNIAKKVGTRAILFEDLDPDSPTYGALAIGTKGIEIARQRTKDGKDWDWTTAITGQGAIATILVTGLLSDKTGKNFWNLDTGYVQLTIDKADNSKIHAINANGETICKIDYSGIMAIAGKIGGWNLSKYGFSSYSKNGRYRTILVNHDFDPDGSQGAFYIQKYEKNDMSDGDHILVPEEAWESLVRFDYDGEAWFMSPKEVDVGGGLTTTEDQNYLLIKNANIGGGHIDRYNGDVISEFYITKKSNEAGIGLELGTTQSAKEKGIRLVGDKFMFNNDTGKNAVFEFIAPKNAVWREGIGFVFGTYRDAKLTFTNGLLTGWHWGNPFELEEP